MEMMDTASTARQPTAMLSTRREEAHKRTGVEQPSSGTSHSPNPSMYFGFCARSRWSPLRDPARSLAKSKQDNGRRARVRARGRTAASRLSRMTADFVTRLAFASLSSSATRSSGSLSEIVCVTSRVILAAFVRNTAPLRQSPKLSSRTEPVNQRVGLAHHGNLLDAATHAAFDVLLTVNSRP